MSQSGHQAHMGRRRVVQIDGKLSFLNMLRLLHRKSPETVWQFCIFSQVIELLQYIGLVFSPFYTHNLSIASFLSVFVFALSAPVFYDEYHISYTVYKSLIYIFLCLLLCISVLLVVAMARLSTLESKTYVRVLRMSMSFVSGILFIPLFHLFLGDMFCVVVDGNHVVRNFANESCSTTVYVINVIAGSIGLVLTFMISLLATFLYDDQMDSVNPVARPHNYVDVLVICIKAVVCIMFHLALCNDHMVFFAFVMFFATLFWAALVVGVLPYYHNLVPRIECALLGIAMLCCPIAAFSASSFLVEVNSNNFVCGTLLFAIGPMVAAFGFGAAHVRVNNLYRHKIRILKMYGLSSEHVAELPVPRTFSLPNAYIVPPVVKSLENDLIQQLSIQCACCPNTMNNSDAKDCNKKSNKMYGATAGQYVASKAAVESYRSHCVWSISDEDEDMDDAEVPDVQVAEESETKTGGKVEDAHNDRDSRVIRNDLEQSTNADAQVKALSEALRSQRLELFVPYLRRMYLATDVEVSTRSLSVYYNLIGDVHALSSMQLLYTLQIYIKGLAYFKQSQYVMVCLGLFMHYYCYHSAEVLQLLQDMLRRRRASLDLVVLYKAHRLEMSASDEIGLRDNVHIVALHHARSHHREALRLSVKIWQSLLKNDGYMTFVRLQNQLMTLRRQALHQYQAAMSMSLNDYDVLNGLSVFVDDLYADAQLAEDIRTNTIELTILRKNRADREAHPKSRRITDTITFQEIRNRLQMGYDNINTSPSELWRQNMLTFLLYFMVCVCLVCSIITFAVIVSHSYSVITSIYRIRFLHLAMDAAERAIYFSQQVVLYFYNNNCYANSATCSQDASHNDLMRNLSDASGDYNTYFLDSTRGKYAPQALSKAYQYMLNCFIPISHMLYDSTGQNDVFNYFNLNSHGLYVYVSTLRDAVPNAQVPSLANLMGIATLSSFYNSILHYSNFSHFLQFVGQGGLSNTAKSLSVVSARTEVDIDQSVRNVLLFACVCAAFYICAALAMNVFNYYKLKWFAERRTNLSRLFASIPRPLLKKLQESSEHRIAAFEGAPDGENGGAFAASEDADGVDNSDEVNERVKGGGALGEGGFNLLRDGNFTEKNEVNAGESSVVPFAVDRPAERVANPTHSNDASHVEHSNNGENDSRYFSCAAAFDAARATTVHKERANTKTNVVDGKDHNVDRKSSVSSLSFAYSLERARELQMRVQDANDVPNDAARHNRTEEAMKSKDGAVGAQSGQREQRLLPVARRNSDQFCSQDSGALKLISTYYITQSMRINSKINKRGKSTIKHKALFIVLVLLIVLSLAVFILSLILYKKAITIQDVNKHFALKHQYIKTYVHSFREFELNTTSYMASMSAVTLQGIVSYVFEVSTPLVVTNAVNLKTYDTSENLANNITLLEKAVLRTMISNLIYIALFIRAAFVLNGVDLATAPAYFIMLNYSSDEYTVSKLMKYYPDAYVNPDEYIIPSLASLPDDPQKMLNQVRGLTNRARTTEDASTLNSVIQSTYAQIHDDFVGDISDWRTANLTLLYIEIGLVCATTLGLIVLLFQSVRYNVSRVRVLFGVCSLCLNIALVVLTIVLSSQSIFTSSIHQDNIDAMTSVARIDDALQERSLWVSRCVELNAAPRMLNEALRLAPDKLIAQLDRAVGSGVINASWRDALHKADTTYWNLQSVALHQAYLARRKEAAETAIVGVAASGVPSVELSSNNLHYNADSGMPHRVENAHIWLLNLDYNFAEITRSVRQYIDDTDNVEDVSSDDFSTASLNDMGRSASTMRKCARNVVFSVMASQMQLFLHQTIEEIYEELKVDSSSQKAIQRGCIICIVLALLSTVSLLITMFMPFFQAIAEVTDKAYRKLVRDVLRVSYSHMLKKCMYFAAVNTLMIVLNVGLLFASTSAIDGIISITSNSSDRLRTLSESFSLVTLVNYSYTHFSITLGYMIKSDLPHLATNLMNERNWLYFRSGVSRDGPFTVASLNPTQKKIMFTNTYPPLDASIDAKLTSNDMATLDSYYTTWVNLLNTISSLQMSVVRTSPSTVPAAKVQYDMDDDQRTLVIDTVSTLRNIYDDLHDGLLLSDQAYITECVSALYMPIYVSTVLFVLQSVVILTTLLYILPTYIHVMERDEVESRIIIQTIPPDVRSAVPALDVYLETGTVVDMQAIQHA